MANEDGRRRTNRVELKRLEETFKKLLVIVLQQGFYGGIHIEAKIQDGVIQDSDGGINQNVK